MNIFLKTLRVSATKLPQQLKWKKPLPKPKITFAYASIYAFSSNSSNAIPKPTISPNKAKNNPSQNAPADGVKVENDDHVRSTEDWKKIIQETKVPIVLDCYAKWCEPCRKLAPILQEKADAAKGAWRLVKLDIDEFPALANALKLRSVPTVILISGGNSIDGFVGYPEEKVLNTFFETVAKLSNMGAQEDQVSGLYTQAISLLEEEKYEEAAEKLKELLKQEEWINKYGAKAKAALGLCYIKQGNKSATIEAVQDLKLKFANDLHEEDVKKFVEAIDKEFQALNEKSKGDPVLNELKDKLNKEPANNDIRYELALKQYEGNLHEEAIANCLDIIKIDRNWQNRKANQLVLQIFNKLGSASPIVVDGRKKLQKILY